MRPQDHLPGAKLAIVGGGSRFVPSIVNGLAQAMREAAPFAVELALYDVRPAAAERMVHYAEVVARACELPLQATVHSERRQALAGADVVLLTVWLGEEHRRAREIADALGIPPDEDGLAGLAYGLSLAPFCIALGAEMKEVCSQALFLDLVNPTDILPTVVEGVTGVRSAGLCVEVEGLRGLLAYHLGLSPDDLELWHVGINHDGWVLRMRKDGQDAYPLWGRIQASLDGDPDFHPNAGGGLAAYRLTGYLRTSLYHNLPFRHHRGPAARERLGANWPDKRTLYDRALDEALASGCPIDDPWPQHPERSPLNYPGTGRQIGRLMRAVATGQPFVCPLQVRNAGAVSNWPDEVAIEVPVAVRGRELTPLAMGVALEWLCGSARLGAIQRRLVADYAIEGDSALLRQAMTVQPWMADDRVLAEFAARLNAGYRQWSHLPSC